MPQRLPPSQPQFPGFGGQLLAAVFGLVVVVSFITLGFIVLLVLLVAGSILWLIFLARRWWYRRGQPPPAEHGRQAEGDTLEGEFEIVDRAADDSGADLNRDGKG